MPIPKCKDCRAEGITTLRPAPHQGPRCTTHNRIKRRAIKAGSWERHIRVTYQITPEQYWEIYEAQGSRCGMCPAKGKTKKLSVDHDHKCCPGKTSCGKCVRGLLCTKCNTYLGWSKDDPEVFRRGAQYIVNPPAKAILV